MADSPNATPRKSTSPAAARSSSSSASKTAEKVGSKTAATAERAPSKKATVKKKRRLGRGIGSLLSIPVDVDSGAPQPDAKVETPKAGGRIGAYASTVSEPDPAPAPSETPAQPAAGGQVVEMIDVSKVAANRHQPRSDFDEAALKELAASIERSGLMQPVVVRSTGNTWELVAGERRLRAIKQLGRPTIPAIVVEVEDREAAEMALIENLQREDLNPMERASALAHLRDSFGLSQQELATQVGLDRSSVANLLRILDLDDFCAAAVRRGTLSLGHAKALLTITDDVLRRTTAAAALNAGWSVRELERRVRHVLEPMDTKKKAGKKSPITARQANVTDLERRLGDILGMRVHITLGRKKGTGKLQVEFSSLEQFDQLTDLLGLGPGEPS